MRAMACRAARRARAAALVVRTAVVLGGGRCVVVVCPEIRERVQRAAEVHREDHHEEAQERAEAHWVE